MQMEVRWSATAAEDLERIFRHIEKDNPTAARETVKAIYDGCGASREFPPPWPPRAMEDISCTPNF
jgi:plasmid stabilization system protein ParE